MSGTNPYEQFRERPWSATDLLALDRTIMANERTLLAYIRTALAMIAVGGSALTFFVELWVDLVGMAFILGAGVTLVIGVVRYSKMNRRLRQAIGAA